MQRKEERSAPTKIGPAADTLKVARDDETSLKPEKGPQASEAPPVTRRANSPSPLTQMLVEGIKRNRGEQNPGKTVAAQRQFYGGKSSAQQWREVDPLMKDCRVARSLVRSLMFGYSATCRKSENARDLPSLRAVNLKSPCK